MIGYYDVTEKIHNHLISDIDINTVVIGDLGQVDLNKQTIFPLSHILVGTAEFINGIIRFSVTVSCMDVVDETKKDIRDEAEKFKGLDNKQDVSNTMLAVIENLNRELGKGDLYDEGWELQGNLSAEPFEDRFRNLLTGWSATFTIDVPNRIQNCRTETPPLPPEDRVSFSSDVITFSSDTIKFSSDGQ